jgi:hypothetical protein
MARWTTISIASALLAATMPAAAQTAPAPEYVYSCSLYNGQVASLGGMLTGSKTFNEDGSVAAMQVSWYDQEAHAVRKTNAQDRASVVLEWPAPSAGQERPGPFDWSKTLLKLNFWPVADRTRRKDETASQLVLDRNHSVSVIDNPQDGDRLLRLDFYSLYLMGITDGLASSGLTARLDGLLAWASGANILTAYDTRILKRPRNGIRVWPRRLAGVFDLDLADLARAAHAVRAATEAWEATLKDFRKDCARYEKGDGSHDIII